MVEVDFIYQSSADLYAVEVKSGRKKKSRGIDAFIKKYPAAKAVFITLENFEIFSKDPEDFLKKATR